MPKSLKNKQDSSSEAFVPKPFAQDFPEIVERAWADGLPDMPARGVPLFALMDELSNLTQRFHKETLKPLGYSHTDYAILGTLLFNGGRLKPSMFTKMLSSASAATSQTLKKLEQQGLLEREESEEDKRSVLVGLTKKGKEVAKQLCEAEAEASWQATRDISDESLAQMRAQLVSLVSALK